MDETLKRWLFDPTVGRLVAVAVALTIISVVARLLHRSIGHYIRDGDTRYRARKFVSFAGYLAGIGSVAIIFSDRLGGLTVAFGVAGAGIALALQEVIASVAGWLAVSFGGFYKVGDRIQLGGIRGDVIDVSILRTTLMECGEWIKGDRTRSWSLSSTGAITGWPGRSSRTWRMRWWGPMRTDTRPPGRRSSRSTASRASGSSPR